MSSQTPASTYRISDPRLLAVACVSLALLMMLVGKLLVAANLLEIQPPFYWTIAGAFLLLHAVASSAGILSVERYMRHVQYALFSFMAMMAVLGGAAWLFSGLSIFEAPSMNVVFLILIICEMILLGAGLFVRNIYIWLLEDERHNKIK